MQVPGSFAKGDGIHPITTGELLHQLRGLLHGRAPGAGFLGGEVDRATQMAAGIQQKPARDRRRIGMVAQHPVRPARDLVAPAGDWVSVLLADSATAQAVHHWPPTQCAKPLERTWPDTPGSLAMLRAPP